MDMIELKVSIVEKAVEGFSESGIPSDLYDGAFNTLISLRAMRQRANLYDKPLIARIDLLIEKLKSLIDEYNLSILDTEGDFRNA